MDKMKWIEPRFVTQVCARWNYDKTDQLQTAYFNGDGFETWQNIWGIWNGVTPRDAAAIRRIGAVLRFFGARGFFSSDEWVPHTYLINATSALNRSLYASAWPLRHSGETVWTVVNRGMVNAAGPLLEVAANDTRNYWNCYTGTPLLASPLPLPGTQAQTHTHAHVGPMAARTVTNGTAAAVAVAVLVEARGYGCVLATPNVTLSAEARRFMHTMHALTSVPLAHLSPTWVPLRQHLRPIDPTPPCSRPGPPPGMVTIPATHRYDFAVDGQELEGVTLFKTHYPNYPAGVGVDVQFPWETVPGPFHRHVLSVPKFYLDRTPVTRAAYQRYLQASGYTPVDPYNFLKGWAVSANGSAWSVPAGDEEKPVTHVSLDEARKYCAFYNKRLPHTWEWQYAGQGTTGRVYPWGNSTGGLTDGVHCPKLQNRAGVEGVVGLLANVTAHPAGASLFGALDMVRRTCFPPPLSLCPARFLSLSLSLSLSVCVSLSLSLSRSFSLSLFLSL